MKKRSLFFTTISVALLSLSVVGCNNKPINNGPTEDIFQVTFLKGYPGGGYTIAEVKSGDTVAKPADPTREGFIFTKWTEDYAGTQEFDFSTPILQDYNLYANWSKETCFVTFKLNNGENDVVVGVATGQKVNEPTDPTREGYDFTGWFLDSAYTIPYDFSKAVNDDLTIYGGWVNNSVRVTFNFNYPGSASSVTVISKLNEAITAPTDLSLERHLYAFAGWYSKANPGSGDEPVDLTKGFDEDITLYAKWVREYFVVTFNPNYPDAEAQSIEVPVSNPVAVPPALVREGYTLDTNWYTEAALTNVFNLNNVTDDVTLYAKWNINHYTVKFNLNYTGATGAPADQDIEYQDLIDRPTNPTREGYTFTGWFVGADDNAEEFNIANTPITENVTLYAHWIEATSGSKVKVTFVYTKAGSVITHTTMQVDSGSSIGASNMPKVSFDVTHTNSDYMFINWYSDDKLTNVFDPNKILTADTTVYGRVLKRNTFEAELINFNGLYGVGSSVNLNEEAMIFSYEKIGDASNTGENWVSNGWYVAGLYYQGAYIQYEINASEAIDDAVFVMRVSSEFHELMYNPLTPDTFAITINDKKFAYELPLTLPEPNTDPNVVNDPAGEKTPFEDVIISYHLHLDKGLNYIRFETTNKADYGAGTFQANAPMIDCIYFFTEDTVTLSMIEYPEYLNKK